jgi:hypothetical protein
VESLSGSPQEIRRQSDCLVEWAQEQDVVLPSTHTDGLEKREASTSEHEVFLRVSDNRVIKCTFPGTFGYAHGPNNKQRRATPLYYLRRLELMNRIRFRPSP